MNGYVKIICIAFTIAILIFGSIVAETALEVVLGFTSPKKVSHVDSKTFTVIDILEAPPKKFELAGIFLFQTSRYYVKLENSDLGIDILVDSSSLDKNTALALGTAVDITYTVHDAVYKFPGIVCYDISYL